MTREGRDETRRHAASWGSVETSTVRNSKGYLHLMGRSKALREIDDEDDDRIDISSSPKLVLSPGRWELDEEEEEGLAEDLEGDAPWVGLSGWEERSSSTFKASAEEREEDGRKRLERSAFIKRTKGLETGEVGWSSLWRRKRKEIQRKSEANE